MKQSIVIFNDGFNPDRIRGSKERVEALGIRLISEGAKENSVMWDYEFPEIKIRKNKKFYNVDIDWNDEHDCCDIIFENGVVFAYVNDSDFKIVTK